VFQESGGAANAGTFGAWQAPVQASITSASVHTGAQADRRFGKRPYEHTGPLRVYVWVPRQIGALASARTSARTRIQAPLRAYVRVPSQIGASASARTGKRQVL